MAFQAVDFAQKQKIDVLILDHHQSESNLPKAFTIYGNSLNEYVKLIDVAKKIKQIGLFYNH